MTTENHSHNGNRTDITYQDLLPFFENENWAVREALDDFIELCQTLKCKPLKWRSKPAKRHLITCSTEVNAAISDFDQLGAYGIALTAIWQLYLEAGFDLEAPTIRMQLNAEKPYPLPDLFDLESLTQLLTELYEGTGIFADESHLAVRLYLAVAFESQVADLRQLDSIVQCLLQESRDKEKNLVRVTPTNLVILPLPEITSRTYCLTGPLTLLLLKQFYSEYRANTGQVEGLFRRPFPSAQSALQNLLNEIDWSLTPSQLVKQIMALDHAVDAYQLLSLSTSLSSQQFLGALTGRYSSEKHEKALGNSGKAQLVRFSGSLIKAPRPCDDQSQSESVGKTPSLILPRVRRLLSEALVDPVDQKRSQRRTTATLAQLEPLVSEAPLLQQRLLLAWLYNLIKNGGGFKTSLAGSSIETYLSSVSVFLQDAFQSRDIAQLSAEEFNNGLELALLEASGKVGALPIIMRFLQFVLQVAPELEILLESFELSSAEARVRAHYIPAPIIDRICMQLIADYPAAHGEILALKLCYYAGLRRDELLSLKVRDLNFTTQILYITSDKRRKSASAVRKFPLYLIPKELEQELKCYTEQRVAEPNGLLFRESAFERIEPLFLNALRQQLKEDTLVLHSLRHSCANNLLFLLESVVHKTALSDDSAAPFFLRHPLFSNENQQRVRIGYLSWQVPLQIGFPVLSEIALRLGHSSPYVTVQSYLHLLDLSLFWFTFPDVSIRNHQSATMYFKPSGETLSLSTQAAMMKSAGYALSLNTLKVIAAESDEFVAATSDNQHNSCLTPESDFLYFISCVQQVLSNQSDDSLDPTVLNFLQRYKSERADLMGFLESRLYSLNEKTLQGVFFSFYQQLKQKKMTLTEEKSLRAVTDLYLQSLAQKTQALVRDLRTFKQVLPFFSLFMGDAFRLQLKNTTTNSAKGRRQNLLDWQQVCEQSDGVLIIPTGFNERQAFAVQMRPRNTGVERFEHYVMCAALFNAWRAFCT